MKTIKWIILLLIQSYHCDVISQCKLDVDSLFQSHFFSLDTTVICNGSKPVLPSDWHFVYLIGDLSKIDFYIHPYSLQPFLTVEDVVNLKKWYWKNKGKLKCEEIEMFLFLMKKETEDAMLEQLKYQTFLIL